MKTPHRNAPDEYQVFEELRLRKNLKQSKPRLWVLETFLETERHVTVQELWVETRKHHPGVGYATVFRTLKLLCECGLCRELHFDDATSYFEHLYGHDHHDHMICTICRKSIEVFDPRIEALQEELMKKHGFVFLKHRLDLYGLCPSCAKK